MPFTLDMELTKRHVSTHEGVRVQFRLRNEGMVLTALPGPFDRSGALRIQLLDPSGRELRQMSRLTSQQYMDGGRIDPSLDLDVLGPGEHWSWDMDLTSCHYPIPPGDFQIDAVYQYPPESVTLSTIPQPINVAEDPLVGASSLRDNPILDRLAFLLEAETEDGPAFFLRHYNYDLPLASWYSTRVLAGEQAEAPFIASASFYQTHAIDMCYQYWIIWQRGDSIFARRYDDGDPSPHSRTAPLRDERVLIRSAFYTIDDNLYLFARTETGLLECFRLEESRLVKVFEHRSPAPADAMISAGADQTGIHIFTAWRGIIHSRIGYSGELSEERQIFRTLMKPVTIAYEPGERRLKAMFFDGPHGKTVHMMVADLENDAVSDYRIDRLPLRDDLLEMSFDRDRKGRFHLLASTTGGKLYYWGCGRGPILVAEGGIRYYPHLVAPLKVFIGCYRSHYGYRFLQYQRQRQGGKFVDSELHP